MFFNDSVKIKWKGKTYDCQVDMRKVKLAESNGYNSAVTNARCTNVGVPPLSLVAEMVYWLLLFGGCDDKSLSEESIYAELSSNPMESDNNEIIKAAQALSELFIPKIESAERTGDSEKKS